MQNNGAVPANLNLSPIGNSVDSGSAEKRDFCEPETTPLRRRNCGYLAAAAR